MKNAVALPCRFSSLRIVRFISAKTEELYKNYLRLKTSVLIRGNLGNLMKKLSVVFLTLRLLNYYHLTENQN